MTNEPVRKPNRANLFALVCCGALVLIYAVTSYSAVVTKSATYDEPYHAMGAWMHLHYGDFRMNFEDPPLWKYIAALPNGRNAVQVDLANNKFWLAVADDAYTGFNFSTNVLYQNPATNDGAAFVNRSRFMMMLISVGLAVLVIFWAWKLGGAVAAVIAATLFCFDPNLMGHGPLIKNDVSMALVLSGAFLALWYVGRRLTVANALTLALITAIAVNTKFSSLLMGPMIVIGLVVRALLPLPWSVLGRELTKVTSRLLAAATLCVFIGAISYVSIWATYGFRFNPSSDPSIALNTVQHSLDAAKYGYRAKHPAPAPEPYDPSKPLEQLAQLLTTRLTEVSAQMEEMAKYINGNDLTEYTREQMKRDYLQVKPAMDAASEVSRLATNFAKNIPPPSARAENFDAQLNELSRASHHLAEQMKQADYICSMWTTVGRNGDRAPDTFIRVLNVALEHKLLPSAWLHGVLFVHARSLLRGSFLMNQVQPTGWWYYFPLAMLFKTPVATTLSLIAALVAGIAIVNTRRKQWLAFVWPLACLFIPFSVYLFSVITANLNIGLRHVLPVYPPMYVAGAVLLGWSIQRYGVPGLIAAMVLGLMLAVETLVAWPNYIAYFNFVAGGPRGGIELLADSNLDWGQDLPALAAWQKRNPTVPLAFGPAFTEPPNGGSYFGTVDPSFYGIKSTPLNFEYSPQITRTHVLAISATLLQGVYGSPFPAFRERPPREVLNGTIYLYDLRGGP